MPTYQYACTECDHRFETVQSFSDPALTDCPECTGRLRKVFNSVGVVFKGSGFYRTDSRSSTSGTKAESSSGGTESKPGGATESKSGSAASTASSPSSSASKKDITAA